MASAGDRYLPDLAKCFVGEAIVFSWSDTFRAIDDDAVNLNSQLVNTLISSTRIKTILGQKVPAFPPPSQQSKGLFETKTSAINVTPAVGSSYDIDEIKQNTLWLSEEVKIAEEEALRITILEWQQDPAERLCSGYSDAELASLQAALGEQDAEASQRLHQIISRRNDEAFKSADSRRVRLINVYFREQVGLLGCSRTLQELVAIKADNMGNIGNLGQFAQEVDHTTSTDAGIAAVAEDIGSRLRALETGRSWTAGAEVLNDQWLAFQLQCVQFLQEILLLRIRLCSETVATEVLLKWFETMAGCEYFANVQPGPLLSPSQIEALQAITSITTLAMLDPATAMQLLTDPSASINPTSYFLNGDSAHDLHKLLLPPTEACIPQASPASLAWALILGEVKRQAALAKESRESGAVQRAIDQVAVYDSASGRRTSSGSFQQSIYEEVLNGILNTSDLSDPATYLLRCAIEAAHVFDTISILAKQREYRSSLLNAISLQTLQELVVVAVSSLGYTSEILASQFSILAAQPMAAGSLPDAKETFIKDNFLMDNIFAVAAGRFPYESLPFLKLCQLLASAKIFDEQGTQYITFRLRTMDSFTQNARGAFASYHTVREDENLNLVVLDSSVNIYQGTQKRMLTYEQTSGDVGIIPADTLGEVISESTPAVIRWQHSFSGLALIGAWLELHHLGQLQSLLSPYESADEAATEMISILTALLKNTNDNLPMNMNEADRKCLQDELLDETSATLQAGSDVVDCVFAILEQELQAYRRRPTNTFNTATLISCINFATVLSQARPDQFWSLFSKSSLLESYGSDSFLLSIVSGVEVPAQNFGFLSACTKLYDSVIAAVLHQSRLNVPRIKTSKARVPQQINLRMHTNALLTMTQSLYSAFETLSGWTFAFEEQQELISNMLATSFEKVIRYANVVDNTRSGLITSFIPAADFLILQLRLGTDDLSTTSAVIQNMLRMEQARVSGTTSLGGNRLHRSLNSLISLSNTLVKLAKVRLEPPSALDRQLFNAIPILCRSMTKAPDVSLITLIGNLLDVMARGGPVSLLGHLGSNSAMSLLEVLKLNIGDWADTSSRGAIWELLSKLVGKNQQWLAIVILTGSPPEKSRLNDQQQSTYTLRGQTFMEIALKQLIKIGELAPAVTVSMLKFVIRAQMNWSWAHEAMKSNRDFLPSVMSHVCNTYVDTGDDLKVSYKNRVAALVTDLSTIHLHHAKANRDASTLKTIAPLLRWLAGNAIEVAGYNHSLQSNLSKNFAAKFSGLELRDFKHAGLIEPSYGETYFYDLEFANEILKFNQSWDGNERYRDQSFSAEFRRANLNLSVVDSEVKLLNSFLNFCIEHSGYFVHDTELQKTVVDIVKASFNANTQVCPPERIFEAVLQTRADIAIALLQRLVDVKAKGPEARGLLKHAWECARTNNGSYEQAIIDNNLTYWRSMLTAVLLALQFQIDKKYMPPAADSSPAALLHHTEQAISTILEIISVVVGRGFRSVAAALQDQRRSDSNMDDSSDVMVTHKDVHVILTIFETILRMTRLPEFISEASQRLIADGVIQSSLMLYSWSHVLTGPDSDNELVYASHSLRFLALLSSLPPVTEELAVEGVLSRLLSSKVTQKLQSVPDGAGHLDKRPHVQALYDLWATGILPICLNLLHSVGGPVAAEVSIFLNQFATQLNRASVAFIISQSRSASTDTITSTVADEATTLALISYILGTFRNAGASAAVDPSTIQLLIGYDEHKKALSEDISDIVNATTASLKGRIAPINEREVVLARTKNGDGLAQKVVAELQNALVCLKGEEVDEDK